MASIVAIGRALYGQLALPNDIFQPNSVPVREIFSIERMPTILKIGLYRFYCFSRCDHFKNA